MAKGGDRRSGQHNSEEQNKKIAYGIAKSGKTRRKHTEEEKQKIGEATKKREAEKTKEQKDEETKKGFATKAFKSTVSGTMLDFLREALLSPDESGVPYYKNFIQSFLNDAVKDPNGQAARMIGQGLFSANTLNKLDEEATKLMTRDIDFHRYRVRESLFDKQQEVYDNDTDKEIMIICSRRSGKTELNARKIIKFALMPKTPIAYIHLTFGNGVAQIFDLVLDLSSKVDMAIAHSSKADGTIEWANGSTLKIFGNDNVASASKLLGFKYRLAIVDEIGAQRNLKILLDDTLTPLMKDFADSQLVLTGTPPRNKVHYSRKLWDSKTIKHYHWTLEDNPFMPNNKEIIDDVCKKKGLTKDDPFIRREFMGDMDAIDVSAQVFRNYKTYKEIPEDFKPDRAYIGVDFGYNDYNGVVSLVADSEKKIGYVLNNEKKFNKATVSEIAANVTAAKDEVIRFMLDRNEKLDLNNVHIITDTNEKSVTFELQKTYGLKHVYLAYKYDKAGSIAQLAELLRTCIFIPEDGECAKECENTLYKRDDSDNILNEIDDSLFHPDILDALRYASRNFINDVLDKKVPEIYKVAEKSTLDIIKEQQNIDYIFGGNDE